MGVVKRVEMPFTAAERLQAKKSKFGQNDAKVAKCRPCCCPAYLQQGCKLGGSIGESDTDAVAMTCTNQECTYCPGGKGWLHEECFDRFQDMALNALSKTGRARNWTSQQSMMNLWTKKGYELVSKACSCLCDKGYLRKNLDVFKVVDGSKAPIAQDSDPVSAPSTPTLEPKKKTKKEKRDKSPPPGDSHSVEMLRIRQAEENRKAEELEQREREKAMLRREREREREESKRRERQRELEAQREAEQRTLEDELLFGEQQEKERKRREEESRKERQRAKQKQRDEQRQRPVNSADPVSDVSGGAPTAPTDDDVLDESLIWIPPDEDEEATGMMQSPAAAASRQVSRLLPSSATRSRLQSTVSPGSIHQKRALVEEVKQQLAQLQLALQSVRGEICFKKQLRVHEEERVHRLDRGSQLRSTDLGSFSRTTPMATSLR